METFERVCRSLRDLGIFLFGLAAIAMTAYYIHAQLHSPEREMRDLMQQHFNNGLKETLGKSETTAPAPPAK